MTPNIIERSVRQKLIQHYTPRMLAMKVLNNQGIERKGITLRRTATGRFRYPLRTMELGQFFFVPNEGRNSEQTNNSVNSCVANIRRKTGRQFMQKRLRTGVQCWRIA